MDVGGQYKIRALWSVYLAETDAFIWVVDSNDRERFKESAAELHAIVVDGRNHLEGAPVLVLANKQDLPNAMGVDKLLRGLRLDALPPKNAWHLQPCSGARGDGLVEGLDWLDRQLRAKRRATSAAAAAAA
eukprot:6348579-Prymnesium_polylepis.1